MIVVRKLTADEARQLCACLLLPAEWGHWRGCLHYTAKQRAKWQRRSQ